MAKAPYFVNHNKYLCCSCGSCMQKCPVKCISMKYEKGFSYPVIDETKCTDCGACGLACQYGKESFPEMRHFTQKTFAVWNKDSSVVYGSTSGGVFPAVAKYVISCGGVVFGAAYAKDMTVEINCAETYEECLPFRKSKYVFSNTADSYTKVKQFLQGGRLVLFTGSPCQVSGLLCFLGKHWDNLITMDFICHGFPSPDSLKAYIKEKEVLQGCSVTNVDFRHKEIGETAPYLKVDFENGESLVTPLSGSMYNDVFGSNVSVMPSCIKCRYTHIKRVSDITMGDFWGAEQEIPEAYNKEGTSVLLVNSEKGSEVFEAIKGEINYWETDINKVVTHNPPLRIQTPYNPMSPLFLKNISKMTFSAAHKKYVKYGNVVTFPYRAVRKIVKKLVR